MRRSRLSTAPVAILGVLAILFGGLVVLAAPANAAAADVKINEFSSNHPDFIELYNGGSDPVDLSGWVLKDNSENNTYTFPPGSSIDGHGYKLLNGESADFAFGLGGGDSVRLYSVSDLTTPVDSTTYAAHPAARMSYSRCADGSGAFVVVPTSKGAPNTCSTPDSAVKINELSSNNPDFIELVNTGTGPVDLSGWMLKDNSENNSYTFPGGSSIAAGERKVLNGESVDFAFGLGGGDSARLYSDSDLTTPLDSYTYAAHPSAGKSYGRCPSGTGPLELTAAATKGAANQCAVPAGGESIKINEVQSEPADLVELTNTGETTVDISGYVLKDNDDTHVFTVPGSTTLAPHGYLTVNVKPSPEVGFGLGKGDSVRLYQPNQANLLDSTTYPADTHAANWGRCPNGTGAFGVVSDTLGAANACGQEPSGPPDVVMNEVESNGDPVGDWVELRNRTASPVNVSGWKILDNDPAHVATPVVVPGGTTIPAGGYYAIYTEFSQTPGFGLGGADSATLFLPDGTTQVDTTSWAAHSATTWGRCPDGTGDLRATTVSTRGLANACSPIRINEVESTGGTPGDWVELTNISAAPVDVSGYVVKDSDDGHSYVIPASTSIAAKGYLVLDESTLGFALDEADAVRLYGTDGTTSVEQYAWTTPAGQSYARCKDGVGDFKDAKAPTKGAINSCPGLETAPWPGGQTVSYADLSGTFLQDLSGLRFDPADPDLLWAAQNKLGTLFKLERDAEDNFVPAAGWPKNPTYPDGTGAPDTEGVTIGPDGFVYLASERNNSASGVSRMSILRYDPAATGTTISATHEWNLTGQIPAAGANLGLEGVAFVPDTYLTANGFKDQSTNATYTPSTYPNHGSGLYFVAVEDTGDLIAFALDSDGTTSHKVATIDSGFEHLADVSFDPELQRVWAVTDDSTHEGQSSLLKIDGTGTFVVDTAYDRPVGMPNLNNEGFAIAPQSTCVGGTKEVVWADDGDTDGHSLRRGTISCSTATPPVASPALSSSEPTITGTPAVGQTLTAAAGTWGPAPVELSYRWYAGGTVVGSGSTLALGADQAGAVITVAVTGTKAGYASATRTSAPTSAVAKGTLTSTVPTIGGSTTVGGTATVDAGAWGPAPVALAYQWSADGQTVGTGASLVIGAGLAGKTLTVTVTGTKPGYTTLVRTSVGQQVAPGTLMAVQPRVTGKAQVGKTLKVVTGAWKPAPVALEIQWYADGVAIEGATGSRLRLAKALSGQRVSVKVTGSKTGYSDRTATSAATGRVAARR